jgi:L-arabinose isomerase
MMKKPEYEIWFVTGSQDLYGEETLRQVAKDSEAMVKGLNACGKIFYPIVWKPVVLNADGILAVCQEASASARCAGIITWMHTFSPAKMWVRGLSVLTKPLLHLHTQFNRDIPWDSIDMDFMNLNQSAHGDREFGHITERLGVKRAVVAGHWEDPSTQERVSLFASAAVAVTEGRTNNFVRFGDNMREVAVTDGDKVAAQERFGWSVNSYGVGELVNRVAQVSDQAASELMKVYQAEYEISPSVLKDETALRKLGYQARLEIALRAFFAEGNYKGFTTNFQDLYGIEQLPGLAAQHLMADGFGFGAEGDWKTACLLRAFKVMALGRKGGTSFMEDYTYHLEPGKEMVLGAHMLEVCPSIALDKPRVEIHPLSIGGRDDPARLVFATAPGEATCSSLVEFGDRFRLITSEVKAVLPPHPMPRLPVAQAMWIPYPDFRTGVEGWIWAGGAHHTVFSTAIPAEQAAMYADLLGIEAVRIGKGTSLAELRRELALNDILAKTTGAR